jgi:hypothetical protein
MKELTQRPEQDTAFQKMLATSASNVNAGAVAIESERAIAEARGQMQLAKMFPRDLHAANAELMDACKLPSLAQVAFYSVPRGSKSVSGPSIRIAEEIARVWGNIEYGHRELSRGDGKSEIEVFAWDKQTNARTSRQMTVMHVVDTRDGPKKMRDQKEIDDKIANVASKQLRGRILALLPKWLVEAALEECRKTLAGDNTLPLSERVRRMTTAFAQFGVTNAQLEKYVGHKLEEVNSDELIELVGVFNAMKEGAKAADYFTPTANDTAEELTKAAIQRARKPAPAALVVETREYADGTSATGVAPLPEQSPAEQEAAPEATEEVREFF